MGRGLDADPMLFQLRMKRLKRPQWKEDSVVVRILSSAKHRLDLPHRPYYLKQPPFDVDLATQRVLVPEQFVLRVVAENDDRRAMLVVDLTEPPSAGHWQIKHIFYRSRVAFEDSVLGPVVLILNRVTANSQFGAK